MIKGDRSRQLGCRHAEIGGDVEDPVQLHAKIAICRATGVLDRLEERLGRQASVIEMYGVTVSSAYRMFWAAMSAATP